MSSSISSLTLRCFNCSAEICIDVDSGLVGRSETCPKCLSDLRVCRNCIYYDSSSYNECREPVAERVKDKERANFCDYFRPGIDGKSSSQGGKGKGEILDELDDLFK